MEVDDLPAINANPTQMNELLNNLISNGLRYHREQEAPVVTVRGQLINGHVPHTAEGSSVGELCQISVEDNGIGFDEKYLPHIFKIFERLHNRSELGGTGIGLAVCRKIVEGHEGNITAKSTPGNGATFIVTLPVSGSKRSLHDEAA